MSIFNKTILLVFVYFLISNSMLKAEWKFQEFKIPSNNLKLYSTGSIFFDKNQENIYYSQSALDSKEQNHKLLLKSNVEDLSKVSILFEDTISNFQYLHEMYNSNIVSINPEKGLEVYDLEKMTSQKIKIKDEYDHQLIFPYTGDQKTREYGQMFVQNDTVFFTSFANVVSKTGYSGSATVKYISKSIFEIWKFYNNKFEIVYRSAESDGMESIYPYDIIRDDSNNILIGNNKISELSANSSIVKFTNKNQIIDLPEHDSVKIMEQANCCSILAKDSKIFARYLCDNKIKDKYNLIYGQLVIYDKDQVQSSFPLFEHSDGREGDFNILKTQRLISYKDYIFVLGRSNIYLYKDNKLSKFDVYNGMDLNPHGQILINDKGIFIVTILPTQGILYNRNIDELIATSGIDQVINNKEYFTVSNNTINFSKAADSYMIYDINAKLYESKSNPSNIETLPDLANGTYFILAKYGNMYLSEKILISK